ncbi:hypothetical protein [Sphingobium sp. LMA1-1-1.1]|uniref:hypothetical protein n=1 Tax=Sphingobium sp. LMA1-1-1.1 TaxID=3135238 RepID=UPI00341EF750
MARSDGSGRQRRWGQGWRRRPLSLLKDGKLGDNYQADGVHMNPAGYRIWANVVRQRLNDVLPPATIDRCVRQGGAVPPSRTAADDQKMPRNFFS